MGLPRNVAAYHERTLREMQHHVRTSFGISEDTLKWCKKSNPGGLGRGNGGGCVNWYNHMLVLENAYEKATSNTVEYRNPDSSRRFRQWLVGFVDDNFLLLKLKKLGYEASTEKLIEKAKRIFGIWHRLVHISGGELELTKSSYSLMTWQLAKGKEKLYKIVEAPRSLSLRSEKYKGMEVELC